MLSAKLITSTERYGQSNMALKNFSHSSIETYLKCSELFRLRYIDPDVPKMDAASPEIVAGRIIHTALEQYLGMPASERPATMDSVLDETWTGALVEQGFEHLHEKLKSLARMRAELIARAQPEYKGTDVIRNKGGQATRAYQKTRAWKEALNASGYQEMADWVNSWASQHGKHDTWAWTPLVETFAHSWAVAGGYTFPSVIGEILALEKSFRVDLPTVHPERLTVILDLVFKTHDGRLVLHDHKINKAAPSLMDVRHHSQLLTYGWAWVEAFGQVPDYIAIGHVPSKVITMAPFDLGLAIEAVERKEAAIKGIKSEVYIKRSPTDYNSPCYNEFRDYSCPFIAMCHPEWYADFENNKANA